MQITKKHDYSTKSNWFSILTDFIHIWSVFDYWLGEDGQVFLWQAKSERFFILFRWHFHRAVRMATHRHARRNLRLYFAVRVG